MTTRSTTAKVTFNRPFVLPDVEGIQAAGVYDVVTDEETIANLSFLAWRRVATSIHVQREGATQVFGVDPADLKELLFRDVLT